MNLPPTDPFSPALPHSAWPAVEPEPCCTRRQTAAGLPEETDASLGCSSLCEAARRLGPEFGLDALHRFAASEGP